MLRHSVLFINRDDTTAEEKARMLRGLAYLGMEYPSVRAGDYGDDVFGGSRRLLEVPPWTRAPRFRARGEGPPSNFDLALHLDFDDEAGLAAYEADPGRQAVEQVNASATVAELTARVDWRHEGGPLNRRGHVRHCSMHVWRDEAEPEARSAALGAVRELAARAGVESAEAGENVGARTTGFDWIADLQFADVETARTVLDGSAFAGAMKLVAAATKDEWAARVTHVMRGD